MSLLPEGILTVTLVADYVRPNGAPHNGTIYVEPEVTTVMSADYGLIILGTVAMPMTGTGAVSAEILNPNDPTIIPGGGNDEPWRYRIREVYQGGPTILYYITIPLDLHDDVLNLADVEREDEQVLTITPGSASVIVGPRGPEGPAGPEGPQGPPGPSGSLAAQITIDDMLAENPFYVAHRGSGGEFPEHTMAAYESVVAAGCKYIEVSCGITADGVIVCLHDQTLDRTTDGEGGLIDHTYADVLNNIRTDQTDLLGANWEGQKLPTLREVMDRFFGKVVIFLEAKTNESVVPIQQMLLNHYPGFQESVIWKAYYTSNSFAWAKGLTTGQGGPMTTWAYVDANTLDAQLDAVDSVVDMWGLPIAMGDTRMEEIVARGKPCICWEVHRKVEDARLNDVGVQGRMVSQWIYVTHSGAFGTTDNFASRVKAPGNIGIEGYNPLLALNYTENGEAYFPDPDVRSALLGWISPEVAPDTYEIQFDMKWDVVPGPNAHSGIAFAKPDDSVYRFSFENESGGYHIVMRASGNLQLYRHDPETSTGVQLAQAYSGTIPDEAVPVAGEWMTFRVRMSPSQVRVTRTDIETPADVTSSDTTYRGTYIHLSTGSVTNDSETPYWRNISVV